MRKNADIIEVIDTKPTTGRNRVIRLVSDVVDAGAGALFWILLTILGFGLIAFFAIIQVVMHFITTVFG